MKLKMAHSLLSFLTFCCLTAACACYVGTNMGSANMGTSGMNIHSVGSNCNNGMNGNTNLVVTTRIERTRGKYLGCFHDQDSPRRGLVGHSGFTQRNSIDNCITHCRTGNFVYAAVQHR